MSVPLALALLWLVGANVLAVIPSRDRRWRRASALIVLGVPLLGWLTVENGPVAGVLALAAGASALRWPVVRLWHRATGPRVAGPAE